jgi:hypothetical protein
VLLTGAMEAQWVNYKTPGIPRLPNGSPNLNAPAPPKLPDGHPDLSGFWDVGNMLYFHDLARGLKGDEAPQLTPWAAGLQKSRRDRNHVDDPYTYCLPLGVPRQNTRSPFKIVQTPSMTIFLHESFVGNTFRQIFTDGRPLPKLSETEPAWLGYSVGHWEGDTLVVETRGFNDRTPIDAMGHPRSESMHVTERYHRPDFGHLDTELTFDDPQMYTQKFTVKIAYDLVPDNDIFEMFCGENEKDRAHMTK